MTEEDLRELEKEAHENYNAMKKRFDETGFFTAEDETLARTVLSDQTDEGGEQS